VRAATAAALALASLALAPAAAAAPRASAQPTATAAPRARTRPAAPAAPAPQAQPAPRAPNAPPLATGAGATATPAEEAAASSPASGGEPLASNGLRSPLCRNAVAADLPPGAARDCLTSGFTATAAPGGDYAFDVHIDTGLDVGNDLAVQAQDLVQFGWTALVAAVHGLIVVLDWCFTLDLLDSPAMSGVGRGLRATQATFTQPWLAAVLAVAAVLALHHGLVRRRVAETVGEALLTVAMMAAGLWVILDPTGTVGVLGAWANQASLGTLGAVLVGTPAHPTRTLAESDEAVFAAAIDGPWCYLEFGDVAWCADAGRLDARLRAAALRIAAAGGAEAPGPSAALLREARTNGALFLALPANGPARNSINDAGSLYNVLCGGSAQPCRGPTAAQARWRTQSGTGARFVGIVFIAAGLAGMMLALGFLALRLLHAAVVSLICLLLTPAAVLAPALGEGGRALFRAWASRLLGAVTSKLIFSLLLGATLESERALSSVPVGWLTQWALVSAAWWIGFLNRHRLLELAPAAGGRSGGTASSGQHRSLAARARQALDTPRTALRHANTVRSKLTRPAPAVERRERLRRAGAARATEMADAQVAGTLEREHAQARARVGRVGVPSPAQARLGAMRAQLARVQAARAQAAAAGETRHAAQLGDRERRLAGELAREETAHRRARETVAAGERAERATGRPHTREQREERARLLDAQAALPRAGRPDAQGRRRDYAAYAELAGYSRAQYEELDPRRQREARLAIDRELALRRELGGAAADVAAAAAGPVRRRERWQAGREFDRALGERLHAEGHRPPDAGAGAEIERWQREGAAAAASARARRETSPVLDDAREVAARRKRQLGWDRR
jgi:hypothetical protein